MHPEIHDVNIRVFNSCNNCCCCFPKPHCFKNHNPIQHQKALTTFRKPYVFHEEQPDLTDKDIKEYEEGLEKLEENARRMSDAAEKTKQRRCDII